MTPRRLLVTGAEGALGSSAVAFFAGKGYRVTGSVHPKSKPGSSGEAMFLADLASEEDVNRLARGVRESWGGVDAVFHCAGGFRMGSVSESKGEDFEFLHNANFKSAWLVARAFLPMMKQSGFGRFVVVSAAAAFAPAGPEMGLYVASKSAVNALVEAAATEMRGSGVTVNAVCPTILDTPANRLAMPNADFATWVSRESLLAVVASLFESPAVNGALVRVAGGL